MEARAFAAELTGTFTLVFIGAGAVAGGLYRGLPRGVQT